MMLTASQVAELLGISRSKIYELAAAGRLISYRFDGALRFDAVDVEQYKAACRVPPPILAVRMPTVAALSKAREESELQEYFRKAGLAPRPTRRIARQ